MSLNTATPAGHKVITVFIVDDLAMLCEAVESFLKGDPEIKVLGSETNPLRAVERLVELHPERDDQGRQRESGEDRRQDAERLAGIAPSAPRIGTARLCHDRDQNESRGENTADRRDGYRDPLQ